MNVHYVCIVKVEAELHTPETVDVSSSALPKVGKTNRGAKDKVSDKAAAIKKAVLKMVGQTGVAGLTMKAIATEANISPGTLYLYYQSKEDMVSQIYLELKMAFAVEALKRVEPQLSFKENFFRLFFDAYSFMLNHPEEVIFTQQCIRSPFVSHETQQESQIHLIPFIELLQKAQTNGELNTSAPAQFYLPFIYGVLLQAMETCLLYPEGSDYRSVGEAAFQFCWRAIKP